MLHSEIFKGTQAQCCKDLSQDADAKIVHHQCDIFLNGLQGKIKQMLDTDLIFFQISPSEFLANNEFPTILDIDQEQLIIQYINSRVRNNEHKITSNSSGGVTVGSLKKALEGITFGELITSTGAEEVVDKEQHGTRMQKLKNELVEFGKVCLLTLAIVAIMLTCPISLPTLGFIYMIYVIIKHNKQTPTDHFATRKSQPSETTPIMNK